MKCNFIIGTVALQSSLKGLQNLWHVEAPEDLFIPRPHSTTLLVCSDSVGQASPVPCLH